MCATYTFCCKWLSVIGAYNHWQLIKLANKLISLSFIPGCLLPHVLQWRLCSSVFKLFWSCHFFSFFFLLPDHPLLFSLRPCLRPLALSPGCASRDQRWLTGASTSNMDSVSKPLPAVQLCHFLLRISPETTKWLGRPWHEKAGTECFSFLAACASLLLSAHHGEVIFGQRWAGS